MKVSRNDETMVGRGNGAVFLCEHRLIIFGVARIGRPLARNIGRQGHCARALQQDFDRLVAFKEQRKAAIGVAHFRVRYDALAKINAVSNMKPFCITDEGLPAAQINTLVQSCTNCRVAPAAGELRRYDAGVVEDQAITLAQTLRQVADTGVGQAALAIDAQHPCRIPRANGSQCYPLGRKLEIKQVYAHDIAEADSCRLVGQR